MKIVKHNKHIRTPILIYYQVKIFQLTLYIKFYFISKKNKLWPFLLDKNSYTAKTYYFKKLKVYHFKIHLYLCSISNFVEKHTYVVKISCVQRLAE